MNGPGHRISGRLVLGFFVIALGVLFTLDNVDLLEAERVLRFWPLVLIAVGAAKIVGFGTAPQRGFGIFLLILGLWIQLNILSILFVKFWDFWPVLLVVLGVYLVVRAVAGGKAVDRPADTTSKFSTFALMGGVGRKNASQEFRGGDATAVMGGCEIDLRGAHIPDGKAVIDTFAFWGGVELRVPEDWKVTGEVIPIMGAFEDKTKAPAEPKAHLIVKGLAIMGGVEVSN